MPKPTVIFFGSFQHYSTIVVKALKASKSLDLIGVVTTPPQKVIVRGKKLLKKTHTHQWAVKNNIPVFTPNKLNQKTLSSLKSVDYFLTAGYSKKLPKLWLNFPNTASLNIHFSLLPKYRGANPAEWAILKGETKTGVSLIKMDKNFDTGPIITQKSIPILPTDTRQTLYQKLYQLAATISLKIHPLKPLKVQPSKSPTPYAKRLTRLNGFVDFKIIKPAFEKNIFPANLERKIRAFSGFPGVWTKTPNNKRLKILSTSLVQLEGKTSSTYNQIKNQLE